MHLTLNKSFKTPQLRGFLLVGCKPLNLLPLESTVQVSPKGVPLERRKRRCHGIHMLVSKIIRFKS